MNKEDVGDFLSQDTVAKNGEITGNKGTQSLISKEFINIPTDSIIVGVDVAASRDSLHWVVASTSPLLEGPEVNIER